MGFQAAGAAPLVHGKPVPNPETIATAIRIGNPASWEFAEKALNESSKRYDWIHFYGGQSVPPIGFGSYNYLINKLLLNNTSNQNI